MRYQVRQKIFSIGDKFTIRDESMNDIYMVKRQILSFGKKLRIYDMAENELCYIEQRLFRLLPEYDIYLEGQHVAGVRKKFAIFKNDFIIDSSLGQYYADGNIFAHEFAIYKDGVPVAHVSKKFFSLTDTYGVDIDDSENQLLLLALVIVIDMVCHDRHD